MGNNAEQIGIRTTLASKLQFESVEGATSGEKLQRLLDTYIGVKNAVGGDIVDNSIELLTMLKTNLVTLEKAIEPSSDELAFNQLKNENEELREEIEFLKGKYNQLNKEYSDLVLRLELKGIRI